MLQQVQNAPPTATLLTVDDATCTVCPTYGSSPHSRCNSYRISHRQQSFLSYLLQYLPDALSAVLTLFTISIKCPTCSSPSCSRYSRLGHSTLFPRLAAVDIDNTADRTRASVDPRPEDKIGRKSGGHSPHTPPRHRQMSVASAVSPGWHAARPWDVTAEG